MAELMTGRQLVGINRILVENSTTHDGAQGLIAASDIFLMIANAGEQKLRDVDRDKLREFLSVRRLIENPYAGEKRSSSYDYPQGYKTTTPNTQYKKFAKLYPKLDGTHIPEITRALRDLPKCDELYQVVPKLSAIGLLYGIDDPYGAGYGRCLEVMLEHVAKMSPGFVNYRKGQLSDKYVRLLAETREYLEKLEAATLGDYIVVSMQSGKLYRGYSVRNARIEIANAGQWSLPSWVIGHHLLTHPKRLNGVDQLNIDCAGDEYSPGADGQFDRALCFRFGDGRLKFGHRWTGSARARFGSASAFLRE